jgi:uncharacterized membrane protein YdbT with pleckstrin-like domain
MAKYHYRESPSVQQKKAFEKYLSEDEDLVLATGLSSALIRSKFMMYLMLPGLFFAAFGIGLGWFFQLDRNWIVGLAILLPIFAATIKTLHLYHANRYLLTTRRVIIKRGIFGVRLTATLYDKITHLEVDQSFVDRLFLHHGSIIVNTAGVSKGEIVLKNIDYPIEIKNLMERLINREREQMGLRATSITAVEGEIIS